MCEDLQQKIRLHNSDREKSCHHHGVKEYAKCSTLVLMTQENQRDRHPTTVEANLEDVTLVWFDQSIDDSSTMSSLNSLLRELFSCVLYYSDIRLCMEYIQSIKDEKIFLIVSGASADLILHQINSVSMIQSVFLICDNSSHPDRSLIRQYPKLIGIYTDQNLLMESIRHTFNLTLRQTVGFSLFADQTQRSTRDLTKDSASFLWYQLLLGVLRKLPQNEQAKRDMLDKCRDYYKTNPLQLEKIEQFRTDYTPEKACEWYSADSFVYRLVNKALRTENIELLYLFRFYIIDLCAQLEHNKCKECELTLYRGQVISLDEFNMINSSIGQLISTNSFFSTSKDINVALQFILGANDSDKERIVLFVIKTKVDCETISFADIDHFSQIPGEQEILFSLASIFRIENVEYDLLLNIWKINVITTDDGSIQVKEYFDVIQKELEEQTPTSYFGGMLWRNLGKIDEAKKYFEILLKTLPEYHEDLPSAYNNLGAISMSKNEFNLALNYFKQGYDLRRQRLPSNHLHIAQSIHNIGAVYKKMNEFDRALDYFKQSFEIKKDVDNISKATTLENIGGAYRQKKNYDVALQYLTAAYELYKRLLPEQHPMIARCFGEIGSLYEDQQAYDNALDYYYQQYAMDEKTLPSEHQHLNRDMNNILRIYKKTNEFDKAVEFCERKLVEQQNSLPQNHPRVSYTMQCRINLLNEK